MPKYLAVGSYSAGTWARLMRCMDDRNSIARKFAESLGGSLECIYWEMSTRSIYAIVDMPDSATMAAAAAAITQTGAFKSVDELKQAIMDYLDNHNGHPKPYIWTKTATEIFSKVARAEQVLESQH